MSSKTWKFVVNNWNDDDKAFFETLCCKLIVFGQEIGAGGTPHLQGHVSFGRTYRLAGLKKLHKRAHWAPAICSDFNYEMKGLAEGTPVYIKDNRTPGKRNDLVDIGVLLSENASVEEIAKAYPSQYIRYYRGIKELAKIWQTRSDCSDYTLAGCCAHMKLEPLEFKKTEVLVGPSGIGKTQYALAHFECGLLVSHIDDLRDFKEGIHDGIVFDDMDFNHVPRTAQIHLVDQDQARSIHCRYETARIPKNTAKIFTCNSCSFPFLDDTAIRRRINVTKVSGR